MAEINVNVVCILLRNIISSFARQINKNQRVFEKSDVISTHDSVLLYFADLCNR